MVGRSKTFFVFEEFRLVPEERLLLMNGAQIQLPIKAFDILVILVENAGDLVTKADLMSSVWPDSFVEEANIQVQISAIRKALNSSGKGFIETVPRRGYRFVAKVERYELDPDHLGSDKHLGLAVGDRKHPTALNVHRVENVGRLNNVGFMILAVIVLGALGLLAYWAVRPHIAQTKSLGNVQFTRLTESGKAFHGAISPDGRFIVYKYFENSSSTLILRDLQTKAEKQLVPPTSDLYSNLIFSPDGKSVYYAKTAEGRDENDLFRISTDGGIPTALINAVDSKITFSPDGERIAFLRWKPGNSGFLLLTANSDGTQEEVVLDSSRNLFSPAWSPDGKSIVYFKDDDESDQLGNRFRLYGFDLDHRSESIYLNKFWGFLGDICWLRDGSGMVVAANDTPVETTQVWYIDAATGNPAQITNDFNDHTELSIDAAGEMIVASSFEGFAAIWKLGDHGDLSVARQITNGAGQEEGSLGISWSKNDRLVFSARTNGYWNLWVMNADGTNRSQITNEATQDGGLTVDPSGRRVVFCSDRGSGYGHLWQVNVDGSGLKQLTNGFDQQETTPTFTPDGKYLIYRISDVTHRRRLMKMPVEGGEPTQLSDFQSVSPAVVSPDSREAAFYYSPGGDEKPKIALLSIDSGKLVKTIEALEREPLTPIRWSPDGKAITYIECRSRVCNLWNQPIDGQKPYQLTKFDGYGIENFTWSPDGNQLAVVRSYGLNNLTLITNFR